MTSTLRTHLEKHDLYHQLRDQLHLKHSARNLNTACTSAAEPFTVEGFHERLVRFIAADDQVSNFSLISAALIIYKLLSVDKRCRVSGVPGFAHIRRV
jgi:hypothetical protein